MDYIKKLEEAKRLYETANADQKYVLESLFPELKEPEDEKVRKALIEMVHDTTGDELWVDYNVHKEEALAWLEKQGEQKPFDYENANIQQKDFAPKQEWSEEDVAYIDELTDFFEHCGELHQPQENVVKWLKSLKERLI
jgi:hypothetical protein